MIRTYSELRRLDTIEERYNYLKIGGAVGGATFGAERYLNQEFYRSDLWKRTRRDVIARDLGCDLGVAGYEVHDRIYVHHMNPMRVEDLAVWNDDIVNPEFLICASFDTHNAVHYGSADRIRSRELIVRRPGDTKLW